LNRDWLKVRRRKNITGETIARPDSKVASYDQFIFNEHLGFQKRAFGFNVGTTFENIVNPPTTQIKKPDIPQVEVKTPQVPEVKAPTPQGQQTGTQGTNIQPTPTTNADQPTQPTQEEKQQSPLTSVFKGIHDTFSTASRSVAGFAHGLGQLAGSLSTAASPYLTYLDVLNKPRVEVHEIPDIPLLDEFIRDPIKATEMQHVFKSVYSRLGSAPPILANTLNRMYDLYQRQDEIRTPYQAERFRRQVSRMGTVLEGIAKWYRYGTELLAKHKDILEQETTTSLEDAANDEARKASIAAGIAAAQFLRAYDAYRRNNVDFPEERQKARLMEAVRNAYYSYVGGSDPEGIDKVLNLATKLVQAELGAQNKPQANRVQQPQQQKT